MQIGAANFPEMMQIGDGIALKLYKSAPILKVAEFMQIKRHPRSEAANKNASCPSASLNNV